MGWRQRLARKALQVDEERPPESANTPSADETPFIRHKRVAGKLNVTPKVFTHTEINKSTGEQRVILVETPQDMTQATWELLNYYVQSLKPKEKAR